LSARTVVLGGGPAGDVAALRAAQLGAEVTLIERAQLGGTCLNWGCIPTKALLASTDLLRKIRRAQEFGIEVDEPRVNFAKMMSRKEDIVARQRSGVEAACKRKKVEVVHGQGSVASEAVVVNGKRFPFDFLIVATGTEAAGLPMLDMSQPSVITSNGVLRLETIPKRLLVIGGGVVGCEFASLFVALGSEVTIVEVLPRLLAGIDSRTAAQFQKMLEKEGVTILTGRTVKEILQYRRDGLVAALDDGTKIDADKLLVSVGRLPQTRDIGLEGAGVKIDNRGYIETDDYLKTANPKIYAVGDCRGGLQLAHKASAEGGRAVENALGDKPIAMDWSVIPNCIYTHPEIASVGLNADTAKDAGFEVKAGTARVVGNGKALAEGEPDGYVQIVADAKTDRILGATIIGIHAVEIIQEIAVAMSDALTMDELGAVIHAHPTVSELVMDSAEQGEGVAPYLS
ncbi:MAG: dihydrolipoyl dehydrogenase, partial [Candidatus Eremiobacteraeota bacterium]|nr:dihydrolipoyl dehydrogenase [Candidatus Eremiobacteraeota bacterium]